MEAGFRQSGSVSCGEGLADTGLLRGVARCPIIAASALHPEYEYIQKESYMPHVFISYKTEDLDFADNVRSRLEKEGFSVWIDSEIAAGEEWRNAIDTAIKKSLALIVIMTPEAKASEYITYEWAFAWGIGIRVIPIMLKATELHPRLEALQHLDFTNLKSRPWDKLIEQVRAAPMPLRPDSVSPSHDSHPFIRQAVASLNSSSIEERLNAIQNLASVRTPDARTILIEALKHSFPDVRITAANALRNIKDSRTVPALIEALKDVEEGVRRAAANSLGEIQNPIAVPALIEMLKDPDTAVRQAAARALGLIEDRAAVSPLIEALKESNEREHETIIRALERLKDPAALPRCQA